MNQTFLLSLSFFILSVCTLTSFAQDTIIMDKDLQICGQNKDNFGEPEITSCNELSVEGGPHIISFVFSGHTGGMLFEEKIEGSAFNQRIVDYIRSEKPKVVYLELITLGDGSMLRPKKFEITYD